MESIKVAKHTPGKPSQRERRGGGGAGRSLVYKPTSPVRKKPRSPFARSEKHIEKATYTTNSPRVSSPSSLSNSLRHPGLPHLERVNSSDEVSHYLSSSAALQQDDRSGYDAFFEYLGTSREVSGPSSSRNSFRHPKSPLGLANRYDFSSSLHQLSPTQASSSSYVAGNGVSGN